MVFEFYMKAARTMTEREGKLKAWLQVVGEVQRGF